MIRNNRIKVSLGALCALAVILVCPRFADAAARQKPGKAVTKPPKGFVALFNGKDLTGWKGLVANPPTRAKMSKDELATAQAAADEGMRAHWKAVDGVLVFDGKGGPLCTAKDYEDFEMLVDWKIESGGDSGIYLRGSPQVQIWDPKTTGNGVYSGGLYNNAINPSKPIANADKPVDEWNSFRILMVKDRVTVYLNGVKVVDNTPMENYWERQKPIYPKGQIELQNHGSQLFFRNVFIREIPRNAAAKKAAAEWPKSWDFYAPPPKPAAAGARGAQGAGAKGARAEKKGPVSLFNGKDLTGWSEADAKEKPSWEVKDGVLRCNGKKGGNLVSDGRFADFILHLEFRVPKNGDSGILVRVPAGNARGPATEAVEVQIIDNKTKKFGALRPDQLTGSIYDIVPANQPSGYTKAGEWQKLFVACKAGRMVVRLNGQLATEKNLDKLEGQAANHPGVKSRQGRIALQNYGTKVEFRNINIEKL